MDENTDEQTDNYYRVLAVKEIMQDDFSGKQWQSII